MECQTSLDEYEKLVIRMDTPRVVIDNVGCSSATLVKVDSARKHGILLDAVQLLADLDLRINKAYISSDGRWFMDVFHVTDLDGRKLTDDRAISYIERSLGDGSACGSSASSPEDLTVVELTGSDRPGLLSEVFAVLADLNCAVSNAKLWTHNGRIASLIALKEDGGSDSNRRIEARLRNVMKSDGDWARGGGSAALAPAQVGGGCSDRRLHEIMSAADGDYQRSSSSPSSVSVQNWAERGYTIVGVQCNDRPKLLFDVVCTLTDLNYVVFHGTVDADGDRAQLEFYIKHSGGSPISTDAERQRMTHSLQAAIERRASEGWRLELSGLDRRGLLADVTRAFRENGLSVRSAEISTDGRTSKSTFYLTDAAGHPADPKAIDAVVERVGAGPTGSVKATVLRPPRVLRNPRGEDAGPASGGVGGVGLSHLGSFFMRNLYNLGLVRSCS